LVKGGEKAMFDTDTIEKLITKSIQKHATNGFKNMTEEEFTKIMSNVIYKSITDYAEYIAKKNDLRFNQ
jgi:hypothetical protein